MTRVLEGAARARARPEETAGDCLVPHRHPGGSCPRCVAALESVGVGGRTAYFCLEAQILSTYREEDSEEE